MQASCPSNYQFLGFPRAESVPRISTGRINLAKKEMRKAEKKPWKIKNIKREECKIGVLT
jgi:hypothetical protein